MTPRLAIHETHSGQRIPSVISAWVRVIACSTSSGASSGVLAMIVIRTCGQSKAQRAARFCNLYGAQATPEAPRHASQASPWALPHVCAFDSPHQSAVCWSAGFIHGFRRQKTGGCRAMTHLVRDIAHAPTEAERIAVFFAHGSVIRRPGAADRPTLPQARPVAPFN